MHVLMVDDETEFLEIMKKRLGRRSMDITTASNGMDGLKCVQAMTDGTGPKFDVVVMDVRMPGMDGLETLGEMKKIAPKLPVILLTGHASVGVAVRGMANGAYDYLLKPVSLNELIIKMDEAVRAAK